MSDLVLYTDAQFISPYAMSVFVALHEKQLPFELRTLDLAAQEHLGEAFAVESLTRRVPTLLHGAFNLSESSAITEYLDETFPAPSHAPLYPQDRQARARARQVQAWVRSDLMAIREERSTETVFIRPAPVPLSPAGQRAAAKLLGFADALLETGRANLFGAWCIADLDLAVMLKRLISNGDDVPAKLADYAAHQWRRPSVQLWLEHVRPA